MSSPIRILTVALAAAVLVLGAAPPATPATTEPVYSGTGWKALTSYGIYSIAPDPYTVVFANEQARTALKSYFVRSAAEITYLTGVPITVTDLIDTTPISSCPSRHRIVVHYEHQPLGLPGYSQARPCHSTVDHSAWGGHVRMNSELWKPGWFGPDPMINEARRKGSVNHEMGHTFGLDHPNADHDGDGAVEDYECVTTNLGRRPLMCSPAGGDLSRAGGYYIREFDAKGLQQMAQNYYLRLP